MLRPDGSVSGSRRASAIPLVAFALAALLPSAGCAVDAEDAPFELHGGEASVRVSLEPFELTILDAQRRRGPAHAHAAAASDAYGAPGATRDDGVDNVKVIPGWDAFVPDEKPGPTPAPRQAPRAHRDERVVRARRRRRAPSPSTSRSRAPKVTDRHRRPRAGEPALEQDHARLRAPRRTSTSSGSASASQASITAASRCTRGPRRARSAAARAKPRDEARTRTRTGRR